MTQGAHTDSGSSARAGYWLALALGGLLVWRWMLPPENVLLGGTLWIAQCSLLLPVLFGILFWKSRERNLVWGWFDSGLSLIVIGHWLSFAWMLTAGGNLRAGLNLCWEWTAIGGTVFVMRQLVRLPSDREDLVRLLIVIGLMFAGIGLWQHYVSYRATISDYEQLRERYDEFVVKAQTTGLSPREQEDYQRLVHRIQELNIPLSGPARDVFERRLADNRQPVGRWALTNSLGGVLAVTFLLLLPGLRSAGRLRWWSLLLLIPVGLCLWKTQSRTAWVAGGAGVFFWGLREFCQAERTYRRIAASGLAAGAVVGGALVTWGLNGLDDVDFASNFALRSLQFRLQYWSASCSMLFDSPLFGIGPGNFREHYLRYKLAASSEQIADPHNAFLDLWANGGLIALAGGVTIAGGLLWRLITLKSPAAVASQKPAEALQEGWLSSPWMLGAEIALIGLFLVPILTTGELDTELIVVAVALPFLDAGLQRVLRVDCDRIPLIAAFALGVHLLGAGGVEMPGIVLFWTSLLVVSLPNERCCAFSKIKAGLTVGMSLLFAAGMWWSTTRPAQRAAAAMERGRASWGFQDDLHTSRRAFEQAASSDPLDPEPWRALAELEYAVWRQNAEDQSAFERALEAWREATHRDPWSSQDDFRRAEAFWQRYEQTQDAEFAKVAVSWYERADSKRPHDERILSGLAFAAKAAGMPEKSRRAAESAIEIHHLSRKNGHWEKLLPEEVLVRLNAILEPETR